MCISGYSLGDRLLMQGTLRRSWQMLEEIALVYKMRWSSLDFQLNIEIRCITCCGRCQRTNLWIGAQKNLATGDVEYESRWYASWLSSRVRGLMLPEDGLEIPMGGLVFQARVLVSLPLKCVKMAGKGFALGLGMHWQERRFC